MQWPTWCFQYSQRSCFVVVRAHGAVDVGAARAGLDRLEGGVLQRDHVVEHPALLRSTAAPITIVRSSSER